MTRHRHVTSAGLLLLLGACSQLPLQPPPTFGESVRHNMALQIVNPEPADLESPPSNGARQALMLKRYETDKTELPRETTAGIFAEEAGGGGAGAGAGAGGEGQQ